MARQTGQDAILTRDGFRLDFRRARPNYSRMARIVLEYVTKIFPGPDGQGIRAVDGISLAVEDGELLTLVGPSGCGKTTTLRLVAGLESPDEGEIWLDGSVANYVAPKDRDLAMVFQHHALYPHLTAFENVAFGLKLRGVPQAEIMSRVRELAGMLSLNDCLNRRPGELSGGQRQRVALGRALARRPRALLLDEPLANLDAPLRRELRRELLRLHRELKLTILLVTHDQCEALALGQRVAVMHNGRIEQIGSPEQVRAHPATPFVAAFLDPSPI